jgi:hypothetical protein
MAYILPNRKGFADAITRIFLRHNYRQNDKDPLSEEADVDLCVGRTSTKELFPYQKLIRDYLGIETPYRGLLVYHGLGSGKTCSSIAVAESLLSKMNVYVLTPASLEQNYRGELRKCGDPIYAYEQNWEAVSLTDATRKQANSIGLTDEFLKDKTRFFVTRPGQQSNWDSLTKPDQKLIGDQIDYIIDQRFTFIRYNGLSTKNIDKYVRPDEANPYDNSVIVIDEVHNLIRTMLNESPIIQKLYDRLYTAKQCKIVALSGTPVINNPNEISYLMNLLRGPIERVSVPITDLPSWDEEKLKTALKLVQDIDTIEFNSANRTILLTRNPPQFKSVYNEKDERVAVQYSKDLKFITDPRAWVMSWKQKVEKELGGGQLDTDRIRVEQLECLPTKFDEFSAMFLDGLNIKNALLFQRRIQGLVSYFKGADERLLPKRVDDDKMLEKVPMSDEQFNYYLKVRFDEIKAAKQQVMKLNSDMGSYAVKSRLACNYMIPSELKIVDSENPQTSAEIKKSALATIRSKPDIYLSPKGLKTYSPKMLRALEQVQASLGDGNNQMVYSEYRSLEGLGVFSAILDANGWQRYSIIQENGEWKEDPSMDANKPAYAMFTGEEDVTERDYMRQIFNDRFEDTMPPSLKASVKARPKQLLRMFMITASGAEGITLNNVRHVHILEPYWNPARHDQVIGRAIRICSHASLTMDQRTVRISFYLSVFSPSQAKTTEADNIVPVRRADTRTKRYEGEPVETFMTTDEYLYERAYEKSLVNGRITTLLKQAAVDCEVHRKLHSRETPVISCMRFDTSTPENALAYTPSIKNDELDETYKRNTATRKRVLQRVSVKQMVYLYDPETKDIFDNIAFEDNRRLLRLGRKISDTQINWILP